MRGISTNFNVALLAAILIPIPTPAAATDAAADFSGVWVLDEGLSDDPREKVKESMGDRRGGGGGAGFGGRGGGIRRGGRPRGGSGDGEDPRERMRQLSEGVKELTIDHRDPEMIVRYAGGRERTLHTDGRQLEPKYEQGMIEATARWKKDGRLVFEAERADGGKLTEVWKLGAEGRLVVTTKTEGGPRGVALSLDRIYNRADEQEAETSAEESGDAG